VPTAMTPLAGKVVLVTGAGTGLGAAICLAAARAGADIAACYHGSRPGALSVKRRVAEEGRRAVTLKADIGKPREAKAVVQRALSAMGRIDVVVNNAAIVRWAPFLDFRVSDWDETLAVNLRGAFLCAQEAARAMVARHIKGRIINISSIGGILAHDRLCAYDAAKGGMAMLTRCAALELAPHGITVNEIAPGAIEVDRTRREFEGPGMARRWKKIIPVGEWGQPEDIARAVLFLASDDAHYITGQTFVVDGGQSIRLSQP